MKVNFTILLGLCILHNAISITFITDGNFEEWFGKCYDKQNIKNQEAPRSVEYFISLMEKIEKDNPSMTVDKIIPSLLKRFVAENFDSPEISNSDDTNLNEIFRQSSRICEDILTIEGGDFPETLLTDAEKCSMYSMLSYNIVNVKKLEESQALRGTKPKGDFNGLEQGVVSLHSNLNHAIALGRVLIGIYAGLYNEDRTTDTCKMQKTFTPLQSCVLTDILAVSGYQFEKEKEKYDKNILIGPGGEWSSTSCTTEYELDGIGFSYASYAFLRGALDGLILGSSISQIIAEDKTLKLSQLLRMYYSPQGLNSQYGMSYCTRRNSTFSLIKDLHTQVLNFIEVYDKCRGGKMSKNIPVLRDIAQNVSNQFKLELKNIIGFEDVREKCKETENIETPKDVYIMLDTKNADDYFKGKQFDVVAELANKIYFGKEGSITVIFDTKRQDSNDSIYKTNFPIFWKRENALCLACAISNYPNKTRTSDDTSQDEVVTAARYIIGNKTERQKSELIVPSKVAIFFNFDRTFPGNDKPLKKALKDLHEQIEDLNIFAVGENKEKLELYISDDVGAKQDFIITDLKGNITNVLLQKLAEVPRSLQYADCKKKKDYPLESSDILINENSMQYIEVQPKYFYSSKKAKFTFAPDNGNIRVCHNKNERKPEDQAKNCENTFNGKLVIEHKNPCKSKSSCKPYIFSVKGLNSTKKCEDERCQRPDSIKFSIAHEGLRCGASGLLSSPLHILLIVMSLFSLFIHYENKC